MSHIYWTQRLPAKHEPLPNTLATRKRRHSNVVEAFYITEEDYWPRKKYQLEHASQENGNHGIQQWHTSVTQTCPAGSNARGCSPPSVGFFVKRAKSHYTLPDNNQGNNISIGSTPGESGTLLLRRDNPCASLDHEFSAERDRQAADAVACQIGGREFQHDARLYFRDICRQRKLRLDNIQDREVLLWNIFHMCNCLFFRGAVMGRVSWTWSSSSDRSSTSDGCGNSCGNILEALGTTAVRQAADGMGYETLITLSSTMLRRHGFDNLRLVVLTFLHELIHSYMFIRCGFGARHCGGHTPGFRRIANMIDMWIGDDALRLGEVEADLDKFRVSASATVPLISPTSHQFRARQDPGRSNYNIEQFWIRLVATGNDYAAIGPRQQTRPV